MHLINSIKAEQVIGSDVEDTRLVLVDRAKTTFKNALDILGGSSSSKNVNELKNSFSSFLL